MDHGHRITHEAGAFYADCPCGAEAGPFATAAEARAAEMSHR